MSPHLRAPLTAMLLIAALASTSAAQIVSPPIARGAVEFGFAQKWFDRDVKAPPVSNLQWEVSTFYGRYGAWDRVTLSAEGGVWDVENDEFHAVYRRYTMGGGISVGVYERGAWSLDASAHYQTVWDNDVSNWDFDKRTYGINVDALAAYSIAPRGQTLRLWAGPTYVDDVAENYLWGSNDAVEHETETHWGVVTGVDAVAWSHASLLAYAIFLENPQWRVGAAWRIGGEP